MENIKLVLEVAEGLGWIVNDIGRGMYEFSKFSPIGQDFNFAVDSEGDIESLIDNIYSYYMEFDVSYETYLWLDDEGHGQNGSPYDMRDLYNDMESCENMMIELHNKLKHIPSMIYDMEEEED